MDKLIKRSDEPEILLIEEFKKSVDSTLSENAFCTVALSGGATPFKFYKLLSNENLPWEKLHFFVVDERFVPLDDEDSNFKKIKRELFDKVDIPKCNIHFVNTCLKDINIAKEHYSNDIAELFGLNFRELPIFDVMFLGIGSDGHVASIFPENGDPLEAAEIVQITESDKHPYKRVTLTLGAIMNSKNIFVLVKGEAKRKIVDKVVNDKNSGLPASIVFSKGKNVLIFTDIIF